MNNMDDLEMKLNSLDKLFDEAHKLSEKDFVALKPENKIGKIQNSWIDRLKPEVKEEKEEYISIEDVDTQSIKPVSDIPYDDIKVDAIEYVNNMEEKQQEVESEKDVAIQSEENKVIDFPTSLIPIIETDYPLVVQKNQARALTLTKKAGSVLTSILITTVILAIGIVGAIFIRG